MLMDSSVLRSQLRLSNSSSRMIFASSLRSIALLFALICAGLLLLPAQTPTAVPVLTWRYDLTHAGQNTQETLLAPSNVNSNSFGKLFSLSVDSTVYAQPLYVPALRMSDGQMHNVLFVATENDSIYAFDADSNGGTNANPIWQISLLTAAHGAGAGATAVPWQDSGSPDVAPTVGITGTPAINLATNTMYVVAATKENGAYFSRLHAINIITGAEQSNSPANITATVAGTGNGSSGGQLSFSPLWENQRPALNYYNGYVYFAYGAHGDNGPWHGWLFAYNAKSLQQSAVLCLTPNDVGGGVWGSGYGMPIDTNISGGRMFVVTGNGDHSDAPPYSAGTDFGESVVAFNIANGQFTPTDEFTSFNWETLNDHDWDQGSGGVLMLPDQPGANPHMLITAGKEGRIDVLNRDNLGGVASSGSSSNTNALQDISGITPQGEGFWSTAAYWNGKVYLWAEDNVPMMFKINNGVMDTSPDSQSTITSAFPDPTFSVSSNGAQDGIAWAVRADQFNSDGPAVLYAWNANDLTNTIYESDTNAPRDSAGPANKFAVPVVTNGKVYIAAHGEVDVYGLLNAQPSAAAPAISPDGGTFSASQSVTLTSATGGATIYYTLDGSTPSTDSTQYSGPISISQDTTIKAIASASGYVQSSVSSATFTFSNQAPAVTFSPAAGTYASKQTVTLSDSDANASIYYTTDGSTPSGSSNLYSAAIKVSASETINAIAIDPALQNSNVTSAAYVIQAGGSSIDFGGGFSSTTGLTLNGSAVATDDTRLQLTDGQTWQAGSVFWNAPINIQSFTTTFEFQLSYAQGNGFTFTIQNMGPTALGGDSAGLGYQDITQSVALKFNFYNYDNEGSDSTGLYTDGEPPTVPTVDISSSGIELGSGDAIQAQVTYDGTTLTLNLLDMVTNDTFKWSQAINIPQTVGGNTAYVGFTGGTGGLSASQKIISWTYSTQSTGGGGNPSFTLSGDPVSISSPGGSTTAAITITPSGGFTGTVTLSCAVTSMPANAVDPPTCTVSQPSAISGTQAVTATLTVNTTGGTQSAANNNPMAKLGSGCALAVLVFLFLPRRRQTWQALLGLLMFVVLVAGTGGCGGSSSVTTKGTTGTTEGNYTVTVTGASSSLTANTAVVVSVK